MMVSNCPRCQIVLGVKLSSLPSWCQIVLLAIMVSNCPKCQMVLGVKLSAVSNGPRIIICRAYTCALWTASGHFSFQCNNRNFVVFTNNTRQSTQSQNNTWEPRLEYETEHLSNGFHHILKWKSYGFLFPRN